MKTKKIFHTLGYLFALQLLLVHTTGAQTTSVIKLGTSNINNNQWGEVLYGIGTFKIDDLDLFGPALGIAGGIEFHTQEISPKISLGASWGRVFTTSLNLNYYPKRGKRFVFTPEIGLNAVKVLHVTYGYQFNQVSLEEGSTSLSRHRISVFLTLPLSIFGVSLF